MKILFCASEVAPFEKTGGLADVAGSLPIALGKLGVKVLVMMPKYRNVSIRSKKLSENVEAVFVENEPFFNRSGLYGNDRGEYPDNLQRFSFFCHEALLKAKELKFCPDIVHAHDWQTALLPVLLKTKYASDPFFAKAKSVMTIHNLAYQGVFSEKLFGLLGLDPSLYSVDGLEYYGKVNLLKGGILLADKVTTVSSTYASEIQTPEYGYGMDGVVRMRAAALQGILNGLDVDLWSPEKDKNIASVFTADDLSGKKKCKESLQRTVGLEANEKTPLFAMVTRLAEQKGIDLFFDIADRLLSRNAQMVLLGEGDPPYHAGFERLAHRYPHALRIFLTFNGAQAHTIYAGCDFFLMPSVFEPCGLGQMIAMRYGALPIVRKTGGLADTVMDLSEDHRHGNGFLFRQKNADDFWSAVQRSLEYFSDKKKMQTAQRRNMKLDFSWTASAAHYQELYEGLLN